MNHDLLMKGLDLLFRLIELVILPLLAVLIGKYVKDTRARSALGVLNEQALLAVQRLNKTRRELKDPSKPGTWTEQEAANLRDAARREVRQALGDSMDILIERFGNEMKVDKIIEHAIDAHAESTRAPAEVTSPSQAPPAPSPSAAPAPASPEDPTVPSKPSAPPPSGDGA